MKRSLLFLGVVLYAYAFPQLTSLIDTNMIRALVSYRGDNFTNNLNGSFFESPKGSGDHSIFINNIWIGGLDQGGNLHVSGQNYGQNGRDMDFGPVGTLMTGPTYTNAYQRVWRVSNATIQYHITNYTNTNYMVPVSIASWPGNGNIANGEAARLAPYADVNNNNTYDPINGDYPIIRGDLAIYFMMNDSSTLHNESGGTRLGVEIHGMVYQYATSSDSALSNTVFINYEIFNRSVTNYDSIFFGVWTDIDLGDYSDDYIGSDSALSFYYGYNGDVQDGNGGPGTYGVYPPAQGVQFLSEPMQVFAYYNNDFSVTGNPVTYDDYYTYLTGKWRDSANFTYGGNGYGPGTPVKYMYSGDPVTNTGWTELGEGNPPADRRGLGSLGPFSIPAGGKYCIDISFTFACDYSAINNNVNSVALLRQRASALQTFYNAQVLSCDLSSGIKETNKEEYGIGIYPNPASGSFQVCSWGIKDPCTVTVYAMNGQLIKSIRTSNGVNEKISLDAEEGIYFVVVNTGDRVISGKVILH